MQFTIFNYLSALWRIYPSCRIFTILMRHCQKNSNTRGTAKHGASRADNQPCDDYLVKRLTGNEQGTEILQQTLNAKTSYQLLLKPYVLVDDCWQLKRENTLLHFVTRATSFEKNDWEVTCIASSWGKLRHCRVLAITLLGYARSDKI